MFFGIPNMPCKKYNVLIHLRWGETNVDILVDIPRGTQACEWGHPEPSRPSVSWIPEYLQLELLGTEVSLSQPWPKFLT